MLLLAVVLWLILTIPAGIIVGRRFAVRRSPGNNSHVSVTAVHRHAVTRELGRSA